MTSTPVYVYEASAADVAAFETTTEAWGAYQRVTRRARAVVHEWREGARVVEMHALLEELEDAVRRCA